MGLLIPIEHPVRVDLRRAARVFAALGLPRVYAERLLPRDRDEHAAVLAAIPPDSRSCARFANGRVTLDELERVALSDGGAAMYVDVHFGDACIRMWPTHGWIQIQSMPAGGLPEAARIVEETTGFVVPPAEGVYELGEGRMVELAGPSGLAIYVHTPDRAAAYALFRRCAGASRVHGYVSAPSAQALAHLPALMTATGGEQSYDLFVDGQVAAELTARVPCDQWQSDHLLYTTESGLLWTYLVAPVQQVAVDEWRATIDDALARTA